MMPRPSLLLTDLYQLTMAQSYLDHGLEEPAVFEFFVRRLPPRRNFLVAAGLEQALDFLENLRFARDEVGWLDSTGRFKRRFLDYLENAHFAGDVEAMPEGTVFFPDEPILRVVAPLPLAQLVETRLINLLHFQTLIASKAARMVLAAPGSMLVEFGLRRSHGSEAGLLAARASYLAGFTGSSNVLAEREFGIPSYGTMAHSYIQAFEDEAVSFEYFLRSYPQGAMLPIDTYDTEAGAEKIVALLPRLKSLGIELRAVRIDSGDLDSHARNVRAILDRGGFEGVKIFASGNLDEYELERLTRAGAPIDGYGVGTRMDTSSDGPYLDCAYKLQEYAGKPRRKRSEGKATWPGRKQVFRECDEKGLMRGDVLALVDDTPKGRALVQPVMSKGKRLAAPSLEMSRRHAHEEVASLPLILKSLEQAPPYFVAVTPSLRALAAELDAKSKLI